MILTPEERNQMHTDMMSWFNGDAEFLEDPAWEPDRDLFCAGWKARHARGKESNPELTRPAVADPHTQKEPVAGSASSGLLGADVLPEGKP